MKSKKNIPIQIQKEKFVLGAKVFVYDKEYFTDLKALSIISDIRKRLKNEQKIPNNILQQLVQCFIEYDDVISKFGEYVEGKTKESHTFLTSDKKYDYDFSYSRKLFGINVTHSLENLITRLYSLIYIFELNNPVKFDRDSMFCYLLHHVHEYKNILNEKEKKSLSPYKCIIIAAHVCHNSGYFLIDKRTKLTKDSLYAKGYPISKKKDIFQKLIDLRVL